MSNTTPSMPCEDCNGRGEVGEPYGGSEFQPPERDRCDSCNGSGRWSLAPVEASQPTAPDSVAVDLGHPCGHVTGHRGGFVCQKAMHGVNKDSFCNDCPSIPRYEPTEADWADFGRWQAERAALAAQPAAPVAQEPVAWRTRYRSEPGMIGHYPWTYTERARAIEQLNPAYEFEPLYAAPTVMDAPAQPAPAGQGLWPEVRRALDNEIDHASINDIRLSPSFGRNKGDLAVRVSTLKAIIGRFDEDQPTPAAVDVPVTDALNKALVELRTRWDEMKAIGYKPGAGELQNDRVWGPTALRTMVCYFPEIEALAASRTKPADQTDLLKRCLDHIESDWHRIDQESGPSDGGLEGCIARGEEPLISELRAAIKAKDQP